MNILHVINSLDPALGGTVACVRELASGMTQRGHTVSVALLSDTPTDRWVRNFPVPCICLAPSVLKYSVAPRLIWWLFRHASLFDVIIINGLWQFQGLGTALVASLRGRPYVVYVHGMLGPLGKVSTWKYIKKFVYWCLFEYWVVRHAEFAVFTSDDEAHLARQFFPFFRWKEAVVGNGTPRPVAVGRETIVRLLSRFPELVGKQVVLYLGRLHPGKGCDILLKAFATELSKSPQYQIVLAGPETEASYSTLLRRLAKTLSITEKVTWTGILTGEDKEAMFAVASVFVSPSHHENFGIAVVEAVTRSMPVIVTNKVNIHGALSAAGAAIVCDDTVDGLRGALREWTAMSDSEKASMAERQRALYERTFTPERSAETLDRVLRTAIAQRSTRKSGVAQ